MMDPHDLLEEIEKLVSTNDYLRASLREKTEECERLKAVVRKAGETFREYEQSHLDRIADLPRIRLHQAEIVLAEHKAARYREHAEMCEAALGEGGRKRCEGNDLLFLPGVSQERHRKCGNALPCADHPEGAGEPVEWRDAANRAAEAAVAKACDPGKGEE